MVGFQQDFWKIHDRNLVFCSHKSNFEFFISLGPHSTCLGSKTEIETTDTWLYQKWILTGTCFRKVGQVLWCGDEKPYVKTDEKTRYKQGYIESCIAL